MRGNGLVDPDEYNRQVDDADGLALAVRNVGTEGSIKQLVKSGESAWKRRTTLR
jgi:hypothetical protein